MKNNRVASALLALTMLTPVVEAQSSRMPATPKRPVADEYQGIKVIDDYRWLEDWNDAEVNQWSAAENA